MTRPQTEEEANEVLREKGVDEDAILSAGTTSTGATHRYWQCPLCKKYMDALLTIDGREQIASPDRIKCAVCGCENLDTVEGEFFLERHGAPIPAGYLPPSDPGMLQFVREGSAMVDDAGFFGEDAKDQEPNWPRHMTAAMIGCITRLNGTLDRIAVRLERPWWKFW